MLPPHSPRDWEELEANAHRPEVQRRIREAIRRGLIRVVPAPNGGIRIIPGDGPRREEPRG